MTTSDEIKTGIVTKIPSGEIIATGVSEEEYMERYAADFCEWVGGTVIKMSPVSSRHNEILRYFLALFSSYFELRPIGQVEYAPFVMQIKETGLKREPDLQIILNSNPGKHTETSMDGAADICIEIVSPESVQRDLVEKFQEYEKGKVSEYWIFDPVHNEARFFRLNQEGVYISQKVDAEGNYRTPLLPDFELQVSTLWQENLPGPIAIGKAVQEMVGQK